MDQRSWARTAYKEVDSRVDWAGAAAHGDTPGGGRGLLEATHSSRFSSSDHDHRSRSTEMSKLYYFLVPAIARPALTVLLWPGIRPAMFSQPTISIA